MKALRGKLVVLLGAGMMFQVGGCSITEVLGDAFSVVIPDLVAGLLADLLAGGLGGYTFIVGGSAAGGGSAQADRPRQRRPAYACDRGRTQ